MLKQDQDKWHYLNDKQNLKFKSEAFRIVSNPEGTLVYVVDEEELTSLAISKKQKVIGHKSLK